MKAGFTHKLMPKSKFVRGVGVLVGGTAGSQLLMVLASLLLTRLYSPEDFGLLAVYAGLLAAVSVVSSLRYELAIPLPESDQDAANIAVLSLVIVLVMTLLTSVIVWVAGTSIAFGLGVPELANFLWLLPLGVLLQGVYKVFNYWSLRVKHFSKIARTRIVQAIVMLATQLFFFKAGGGVLLAGHVLGQGSGAGALTRSAFRRDEFKKWQWKEVWRSARRYRKFPMFSTWEGLFNVVGQQLPALMFAALFNIGAAGLYSLAQRVLAVPISILGQAVANVFLSSASNAYRENRLNTLVASVHGKLVQIAMPPALALMLVGPDLFSLVFGDKWRLAGEFARWMAPWLYLVFVTSPLSTLFTVTEKQHQGMMFQMILLFTRAAAITLGAWYGDLLIAVILFSVVSALCWVGFLIWITLSTNNQFSVILKPWGRAICYSILITSPLWLGSYWSALSLIWFLSLASTAVLTMTYYWFFFTKNFN